LNSYRTAKQCQERWTNLLDPARTVAEWSLDEDATLLQKYSDLSGQFSQIRRWLPGRSYNDCQSRFYILRPEQAPKSARICMHGVPVRSRCKPCNGYDICVHRVHRNWCRKCGGKLWHRAVISKRMQYMLHNPASEILARVKRLFETK
jgi:hypothetical protein